MISSKRGANLAKYRDADASEANYATPHRLVQMLMEGALDKISIAKGAIERNDIPARNEYINWAISIVDGLKGSLDLEAGGEIAHNLDGLYFYMNRRLVEANVGSNIELLNEVSSLLREVKEAWDSMPDEIRHARNRAEIEATIS